MKHLILIVAMATSLPCFSQARLEYLDRGFSAIESPNGGVLLSWRLLASDPLDTPFSILKNGVVLNPNPILASTNWLDPSGSLNDAYTLVAPEGEIDQVLTLPKYLQIDLQKPADGVFHGAEYSYEANDCSTADLNNDGRYEIIVKWSPTNAKDNSHSGYTGPTILDAYDFESNLLWRIDLGPNIRSGAHYTQFMVYDFEGDGVAELICKTAPGSKDSEGNNIILGNDDPNADYTNGNGYVLDGPEYLTAFDGGTGKAIHTVNYLPARGNVSSWGDGYGNRVDRFLAGVAYLDGTHPSALFCRGYYTRTVIAAWDYKDKQLQLKWLFDTDQGYGDYAGKGNHQLSIADLDADGNDEVIYGAITVDDDGTGMHASTWGHGDALHVTDHIPDRPGQEIFMPVEYASSNPNDQRPALAMRDGLTSEVIWQKFDDGDFGRGVCANIDANYRGSECWTSGGHGLFDQSGNWISNMPSGINFTIWWDGDLTRELLDGTKLDDWNGGNQRIFTIYQQGVSEINGTKANPNLQADLFGDWREELVYRTNDNNALRIFSTWTPTDHRLYTLMHDRQYRLAVAWQNVGYNQPPHPSYYIGQDMSTPEQPDVTLVPDRDQEPTDCNGDVGGSAYLDDCNQCVEGLTGRTPCKSIIQAETACYVDGVESENNNGGFNGQGYVNTDNYAGASAWWMIQSAQNQSTELIIRYANGGNDRPAQLMINGSEVALLDFPPTGAWTQWADQVVTVQLDAGTHEIALVATGDQGLPNVDQFGFTQPISAAGCLSTDLGTIELREMPVTIGKFDVLGRMINTTHAAPSTSPHPLFLHPSHQVNKNENK